MKKLIEKDFPSQKVGQEASKEKSINMNNISGLHIWWSRKPLTASRAAIYSALVQESKQNLQFVSDLAKWKNSLNKQIIQKARQDIIASNKGKIPKVLDCFAGGGSIPLEAARLGCETYALDYNPVAAFLLKCTIEYPFKYATKEIKQSNGYLIPKYTNKLLHDFEYWANWVFDKVKEEMQEFYPKEENGDSVDYYYWVRAIDCTACGAEIPLIYNFWIVKMRNKKVCLVPYIENKQVRFKICGTGYKPIPKNFNPEKGTIKKAQAHCLVCNNKISPEKVKALFHKNKVKYKIILVAIQGKKGKYYRLAEKKDYEPYTKAESYLSKKLSKLSKQWNIKPLPDEEITNETFEYKRYGYKNYSEIHNSRQKLIILTSIEYLRKAYDEMILLGYEKEYAKVIVSYIALCINKLIDKNSIVSRIAISKDYTDHSMKTHIITFSWDYGETNPIKENFSCIDLAIRFVKCSLEKLIETARLYKKTPVPPKVLIGSATNLPFTDNFFDAVITDPPYYDSIEYANVSNFFYVWLKRSIGYLYPELFNKNKLVDTKEEIVPVISNEQEKKEYGSAREKFRILLQQALKEIYRVTKEDGIVVLMYASKHRRAWVEFLESILAAGFVITETIPIPTELKTRIIATKKTASLQCSMYVVCRKSKKKNEISFKEIEQKIKEEVFNKLYWAEKEEITGTDLTYCPIGAAMKVFSQYKRIIKNGNIMQVEEILDYIQSLISEYALHRIDVNKLPEEAKFYLLFRYNYGESPALLELVKNLAEKTNLSLNQLIQKGLIQLNGTTAKLLNPKQRKTKNFGNNMIDLIHKILVLWNKQEREEVFSILARLEDDKLNLILKIMQSIALILPEKSEEKKLIDSFLTYKEEILAKIKEKNKLAKYNMSLF